MASCKTLYSICNKIASIGVLLCRYSVYNRDIDGCMGVGTMEHVQQWYSEMSPQTKLKFYALTQLMGAERVAAELVDVDDIDELFERVADRVYASAVQ